MIVYRQQERVVDTRTVVEAVERQLVRLRRVSTPRRDAIVAAFVDAGELASAIADERAQHRDVLNPQLRPLVDIVIGLARAADGAWRKVREDVCRGMDDASKALGQCNAITWPHRIRRTVSEGFAYYGVGPELYADAARRWAKQSHPEFVWCVGLRTIGLPLAASAAAALRGEGIDAGVVSIRPRGHPFRRRPVLDDQFAEELLSRPNAHWLVIDEGPGISGSSMAGTADCLREFGAPPERITMIPAYQPNVSAFADDVRSTWERHAVQPADFDASWMNNGRLRKLWNADSIHDMAAGRWRDHVTLAGLLPASNSLHERRKYRIVAGDQITFLKFAGHGRYGERLATHAITAAAERWGPTLVDQRDGWSSFVWHHERFGAPQLTATHLEQLADYLCFICRTRATGEAVNSEPVLRMAVVNAREACGDAAAGAIEQLLPSEPAPAFEVDGRLRPHEWFETSGRLQKTDGLEHGDDHFFPGPTDIAWDVAGLLEEWRLDDAASRFVVGRFRQRSGDHTIERRLPFYRAAYLAFRVGYTALSRDQLRATPEAARFEREHAIYRKQLQTVTAP